MEPTNGTNDHPRSRIWVWVVVACLFQVAVWAALFVFASHHPVEEIPLGANRSNAVAAPARTKGGGPP